MHRLATHVLGLLEDHHPETAAHAHRLARYAALLLPRDGPDLALALLCHDAGKLAIPPATLARTDGLRLGDWPAIAAHPAQGEAILRALCPPLCGRALPRSYAVVARSHHERWDGRGYPDGLVGRLIPFRARLAAILDAFDAMTTRTYRHPLPPRAAAAAIVHGAGSQFDPRLAAALAPRLAAATGVVLEARPAHACTTARGPACCSYIGP